MSQPSHPRQEPRHEQIAVACPSAELSSIAIQQSQHIGSVSASPRAHHVNPGVPRGILARDVRDAQKGDSSSGSVRLGRFTVVDATRLGRGTYGQLLRWKTNTRVGSTPQMCFWKGRRIVGMSSRYIPVLLAPAMRHFSLSWVHTRVRRCRGVCCPGALVACLTMCGGQHPWTTRSSVVWQTKFERVCIICTPSDGST